MTDPREFPLHLAAAIGIIQRMLPDETTHNHWFPMTPPGNASYAEWTWIPVDGDGTRRFDIEPEPMSGPERQVFGLALEMRS